jgi:hypothetical protein
MFFKHVNELGLIQFPFFFDYIFILGFLLGPYRKVFNEGTNEAALYFWNLLYKGTDKN